MAEDDDDDSFGDFTFATASNSSSSANQFNQQQSSSQICWPKSKIAADEGNLLVGQEDDDDDEWGDFVETPLGSGVSSDSLSKTLDAFNFFASNPSSQSQLQSESASATRVESGPSGLESEKKTTQQWVKVKGAIPLSIFGDADEEEEQTEEKTPTVNDLGDNGKDSGSNVKSSNYDVNSASKGNGYLGVGMNYDVIANLYNSNKHINLDTGLGNNNNFSSFSSDGVGLSKKEPILELNESNLDLSGSAPKIGESDAMMNLDNQSHKVNIQDGARSNGAINSNLGALQINFGGLNIDMNQLNVKSELDAIGSASNQSQLSEVKTGNSQSNLNVLEFIAEKKSSDFGEWNFDFDGLKPNSNGIDLDIQVSSSNANGDLGDDNEEDGWDFKDAFSESIVSKGQEKAQSREHKGLEENGHLEQFVNNSSRPFEFLSMSSGSFDLFSTSNGISGSSHNIAVGVDSNSSVAAQNGYGSGKYLKEQTKSNCGLDFPVENVKYQEGSGQFSAAFEETGPREESLHDGAEINSSLSQFSSFLNGSTDFFAASGSIDIFAPVNGNFKELAQVDVEVDTDPTTAPKIQAPHNDCSLETHSRSEKINDQGVMDSPLFVVNAEFDDDFGEFTAASEESAQVPEGTEIRPENDKGPLPLSIFGVEEQEVDSFLDIQDAFPLQSASHNRDNFSSNSTISINDFLSHLYSQSGQISSDDSLNKPIQNGLAPCEAVLGSNGAKDTHDFDDNSWEFKDAFLERGAENGTCLHNSDTAEDSSSSTQLKLNLYIDFYSKLLSELQLLANCHLESLKEAQTSTISDGDEKLPTLIEEIQGAFNESGPKNAISEEALGDYTQSASDISGLLQILQEPEFQILESEYSLQTKLSLVEKDSRMTIQLIKHAETALKILSLGSLEEQLAYVSIWSKMISVCVEELQYGAQLWRQACEKNVQNQILAEPQGKGFLLALGEIYRVAIILEASVKLYKPWTLLSDVESSGICHLLDECHNLWHSSGLEEALLTISVSSSLDDDNSASSLVDSIKYSHDLDAHALENHVLVREELLCRLSFLSSSVVPGMTMVDWGGERCFVKLANFWANLISSEIPKLPSLCVNC